MKGFNFIFLILFFIFLSTPAFCATVEECKSLYDNAQYDKASSCFYSLYSKEPRNPRLKLFYGNALYAQKRYNSAKIQYTEIIQRYPNTPVANSAKKNLDMTNAMLREIKNSRSNDSGDYVSEIVIAKWQYMPIKVWIQNGPYKSVAKKAFMVWQSKTKGIVRFQFVEKYGDARIVVSFPDDIEKSASAHALGVTGLSVSGGKNIVYADVKIKVKTRTGANQTTNQIYPVLLHEIGHALGIRGHSSSKYDVMYLSDANYRNELSNRDVNTILKIYR